jgi:hypothetical protein
VQSFPNYYVLGPNIEFFAAHGVKGIFEEGPGVGVTIGGEVFFFLKPPVGSYISQRESMSKIYCRVLHRINGFTAHD